MKDESGRMKTERRMVGVDSGVYIGIFHLPRERRIAVGTLGRFRFAAGVYVYVGSAQRRLSARLARHARREKPLRWHIDYLSRHARMLGAVVISGKKDLECRLAARLAKRYPRPVVGFGSSDCGCGGHLFRLADLCGGKAESRNQKAEMKAEDGRRKDRRDARGVGLSLTEDGVRRSAQIHADLEPRRTPNTRKLEQEGAGIAERRTIRQKP